MKQSSCSYRASANAGCRFAHRKKPVCGGDDDGDDDRNRASAARQGSPRAHIAREQTIHVAARIASTRKHRVHEHHPQKTRASEREAAETEETE